MTQKLETHVLAAFYNDARINILLCLNDIREKAHRKRLENEDQIISALDGLNLTRQRVEEESKTETNLYRRFPFLRVLTDPEKTPNTPEQFDSSATTPQKIEKQLRAMLSLVNDLRNATVHPTSQHNNISKKRYGAIHTTLDHIYDAAIDTIKQRFGHDEDKIKQLRRCDHKGKSKKLSQHLLALYPDGLTGKNKPKSVEPQTIFSDFGHVLFCSLFLERREIAELIKAFSPLITNNRYDIQIIQEIVSVYRLRMPIQRLQSTDTQTALTLDTLTELSRCPRPLLNTLHPDDQARFRYQADDDEQQSDTDIKESLGTYLFARSHQDRFRSLIMRFFDFDEQNQLRFAIDLGDYHYHVRLKPGTQFTDGHSRVRRLSKKLIGYGRLDSFLTKPDDWQQLEQAWEQHREQEEQLLKKATHDTKQLQRYIVPAQPHYHHYDDKIGCRLATSNSTDAFPDLNQALDHSGKRLTRDFRRSLEPEFWIRPVQLLHLAFYHYLWKKTNDQQRPEKLGIVLQKYRAGMKRLLSSLQNTLPELAGELGSVERKEAAQNWLNQQFNSNDGEPFEVALNALPSVIVRALLGKQGDDSRSKVLARLDHMIARTEQRLRQLENALNYGKKRGKKGFKPIKCGVIADFVCKDLMRFQPIDTSKSDGGKINSQQYQILQAALAYYNVHLDEPPKVVDLFKNAGLLGGKRPHPFLSKLGLESNPSQYQGILSFYQAYLQQRKTYLNHYRSTWEKDEEITIPHWLRLRQPSTLKNWLGEQFDHNNNLMPIPLVDNMLYRPILTMLAQLLNSLPDVLEKQGSKTFSGNIVSRPSVTWLIRHYLETLGDEPQKMYRYKRHYDLIDVYLDKRKPAIKHGKIDYGPKPRQQHFLDTSKRQEHLRNIRQCVAKTEGKPVEQAEREKLTTRLPSYIRNENRIRYHIPQDILLWLYARDRLASDLSLPDGQTPGQWQLKTIAHTLLDSTIEHQIKVPDSSRSIKHRCKVRNLGELYRLVRDRRLKSLLDYYPETDNPLSYDELRAELADYQRGRIQIMRQVHELEKAIQQVRDPATPGTQFGRGEHGKLLGRCYDYLHAADAALDQADFEQALKIRNAFSHNQYPDSSDFKQIKIAVQGKALPRNPGEHRKAAQCFVDELQRLYKPWLKALRQGADRSWHHGTAI